PILHSDGSGPVKGTLVFARYLTVEDSAKLGELTKLNLHIDSATDSNGRPTSDANNTSANSARTQTTGSEKITGYQLINDVYGKPLLIAKVEQPRSIFQETQRTLVFYILIVMGVSLTAIIIVMYTTGRIMRQNRDIETEKATKKEIEKQVVDRTREANDEQARLRSAIDSMESGMLITFKDRDLITYNPSLINILGLRAEANVTRKADTNMSFEQIQQKLAQVEGIDLSTMINQSQDNGKTFRIKEATYNNRVLSVFITPVIVYLDKIIGSVLLIEDITEQKVQERSKDEFFSIASHELRTPLTAIKGNSSMILDFYKDILKDDQLKEMILDVHESSVRLIGIVNDFLDVSRLEQGKVKFNYESVNLEEIIEKVAYEMKAELTNSNLKLDLDKHTLGVLPKVWVDNNRLKQVVYNLVGNAAKFTEKGTISISAVVDKNFVKVQVTDTGRGMSPEAQRLLFHKFQQTGDSLLTRDTTRGTGLGLYISKMIIESMGGTIALEKSAEGVGSTFSFTVPIATKSKIKSKPKQESTNASTGMTSPRA
ncbi:MAG: ATP-binding protein, partial [Patescibacteria group bacterium]